MALVNPFDVGACLLTITQGALSFSWSGNLSKGQSTGSIPGANFVGGAEMIRLSVSSTGVVLLEHVSGSQSDGYQVDVAPSQPFLGGQVQSISLPVLSPGPQAVGDGGDSGTDLTYSGGGGAVTPDPATLDGTTQSVGLYQGKNI
jgi:hypothetical protein